MKSPMRIHAITVCLNYSDYLERTVRANQPVFDDWVVVTHQDDKGTRAVCERHGIRTAFCPYFTRNGSKFNKALAINIGLAHAPLNLKDGGTWLIHIDADIELPHRARSLLNNNQLDTKSIYGVDRVICPSYEEWVAHRIDVDLYQKNYFARPPREWKIGSRLLHFSYGDYAPIGFFQMWHTDSEIIRYPEVENSEAEHTDMLHSLQWSPDRRHLIPSFFAIHLETGERGMGMNWNGRTTSEFGPKKGPYEHAKPDIPIVSGHETSVKTGHYPPPSPPDTHRPFWWPVDWPWPVPAPSWWPGGWQWPPSS